MGRDKRIEEAKVNIPGVAGSIIARFFRSVADDVFLSFKWLLNRKSKSRDHRMRSRFSLLGLAEVLFFVLRHVRYNDAL